MSKVRFNITPDLRDAVERWLNYYADQFLQANPMYDGTLLNKGELTKVAAWLANGRKTSLMIMGRTGSGKTIIAKTLARVVAMENPSPNVVAMANLVKYVKREDCLPEFVYENRMLVLDDLGTEPLEIQMYGNRYELFNEILFARYAQHQPTIITTNLNSEGIRERYGDRIFSRIVEMFDKLILNAEDLRMRK